ncbi:MAG: hypothetical protein AB1758_00450, partial [Candidatus Eremiobacterota bacterium]
GLRPALPDRRRAGMVEPMSEEGWKLLGEAEALWKDSNQSYRAPDRFRRAYQHAGGDPQLLLALCRATRELPLEAYDRALQLAPDDAGVLANRGLRLLSQGYNVTPAMTRREGQAAFYRQGLAAVEQSLPCLTQALERSSDRAARGRLESALGEAHGRLGHFDVALEHHQRARSLLPDDPIVEYRQEETLRLLAQEPENLENSLRQAEAEQVNQRRFDVGLESVEFQGGQAVLSLHAGQLVFDQAAARAVYRADGREQSLFEYRDVERCEAVDRVRHSDLKTWHRLTLTFWGRSPLLELSCGFRVYDRDDEDQALRGEIEANCALLARAVGHTLGAIQSLQDPGGGE